MRRNESTNSREIVPTSGDYPRPVAQEYVVGDYYYGRSQTKSALARSYLHLFLRQKWTIILTFLLMMGVGMGWTLTRTRLYRSTAEMLVVPIDQRPDGKIATDIQAMTHIRSVATEVKMMSSQDLLDDAFAALPRALRLRGFGTTDSTLPAYPIAIANPRDTDVITVQVTAQDPKAAATFADQIILTNNKRHMATVQSITQSVTQHVNNSLAQCDRDLSRARAQLAAIKQRGNIADFSTDTMTTVTSLANLETEATKAEAEMTRAQLTKEMLAKQLASTPAVIEAARLIADNPVLHGIDTHIAELEQQRTALLQEYQLGTPEINDINEKIAEARRQRDAVIDKKVESVTMAKNPVVEALSQSYINAIVTEREAQSRMQLAKSHAGNLRGRIATFPQTEQRLAATTSRILELENTHRYLVDQKEALKLSSSIGLPNIMPITRARPANTPISPNIPATAVLLVVLSSFVAVGLAVLRDQLDDRIHTAEVLESSSGQRVLASLPRVRNGFRGLVTDSSAPPALLESFRILRGNILLSMPDPLPRVIMVTSSHPGEGKSTTTANLAATIALTGKRVLVIDCDLRHPSVHLAYGLSNACGLSSYLLGEVELAECLQTAGVENLRIITAGPTPLHPPELLASPELRQLIEEHRDQYDCILLDSTPLMHLSDGAQVASLAEGAVVVVHAGRTRLDELHTALRILEQIDTPILGLVYNQSSDAPSLVWRRPRA